MHEVSVGGHNTMLKLEASYEKPTLLVWLLYGMEPMN